MKYIFPSLLQTANDISSFSWFDIKRRRKKTRKKRKKRKIKLVIVQTTKFKLELTDEQQKVLKLFLDDVIDVYNLTNEYIKTNKLTKKEVNFRKLRTALKSEIKAICAINGLHKHTADYSVKHCVEMYKSAFSNMKNKEFNIKNLDKTRRRKNLVIEPCYFSKKCNTFFGLGAMISSLPFKNNISRNSILQYDTHKRSFIIITPYKEKVTTRVKHHKKCGIDIGVRTFLTTYNENESYEIGTNTNRAIDRLNKRIDKYNSFITDNLLSTRKCKDTLIKYSDKLKNKMSDMHNKAANFLLKRYDKINIGNVSIKRMLSNTTGNLYNKVKRRLVALSHYKFRMKLKAMAPKFGTIVNEIDEYMTSKTCHNCQNIKKDLGSAKVYKCEKCNVKLDRDINAAINIYKL